EILLKDVQRLVIRVRFDDDVNAPERPRRVTHGTIERLLLAVREEERDVLRDHHNQRAIGIESVLREDLNAQGLRRGPPDLVGARIAEHDETRWRNPLLDQQAPDVFSED